MPQLIAVFDTNVYRSLAHGKQRDQVIEVCTQLRADESARSVVPMANFWTALELLAGVGDKSDPEYSAYLTSIVALWTHCRVWDHGEYVPLVVDSEAQLCRTLFGKVPPGHENQAQLYNTVLRTIVSSNTNSDLEGISKVLRHLRAHCLRIEFQFIDDMRRMVVQGLDPGVTDWRPLRTDPAKRKQALDFIRSGAGLSLQARALVAKAAAELGLHPGPNEVDEKAEVVQAAFPTPLHLYSEVLRKIVQDGCDFTKKNRANFIWDIQISFAASPAVSLIGCPVVLVTDDRAIRTAATRAGAGDRALRFQDYRVALASGILPVIGAV